MRFDLGKNPAATFQVILSELFQSPSASADLSTIIAHCQAELGCQREVGSTFRTASLYYLVFSLIAKAPPPTGVTFGQQLRTLLGYDQQSILNTVTPELKMCILLSFQAEASIYREESELYVVQKLHCL